MIRLIGRRVILRPLVASDFAQWSEVRLRNRDWLTRWEPRRAPGASDPALDPHAFALRCNARERERQLGAGHGFAIFVDGQFAGEINLNAVQRGPFQNAYVGYWIDEERAGHGYVPEALVLLCKHAFEELHLHRLQVAIIPRNRSSRRVVEKLAIREEGLALRYLEINGVWEDHLRFGITAEEWDERRDELLEAWIA
ncbi:MAG: GNAT family N-acetyltransferase [Acidimicrobiales bacterium]|nr:GNAT family N-acetyltransferase [Acidimicrobiales bacterium]